VGRVPVERVRADEVYVQTFPGPGEKSRISTNGGTQARWRRDARELFYLAPLSRCS